MTSFLFDLSFYVAAPFWALMILAPTWRLTRLIAGSPLIVLPAVAVELVLLVPLFGEFWPVVTRPSLEGLQELVTRPEALTALWAQIIAWDLFLGRWMYLDSRERSIHPLVMAPTLIFTILLSPIALPIYLVIRLPYRRNTGAVGAHA
ncbi:ABA4-like family protein [Nonomuraea sp. NPDC050786]|uniref:ABA4-like family protein n=1 Tax=Nonomuraea sp. NPDC050786 TaxID=3154840 RepID=UPI0033C9A82C